MPVAVIIPTLNEEESIGGTVQSAIAAGAAEVIVVDGGSFDRTARFATAAGARVLLCESLRARQLNRGAEAATSNALIFLHADTRLPAGAAAAVESALKGGAAFGAFRLRFQEPAFKLRVAAAMINLRSIVFRNPWGDQAQFIGRNTFLARGGFREMPLLEDYELARRMKTARRTRILPLTVTTSARRFVQKGVWRTALTNWRIIWMYAHGADVEELAKMYRR